MNRTDPATKAQLRRELRAEAQQHDAREREQSSQAVCSQLGQKACYLKAQSVMFFAAMAEELDLRPLAAQALADGKQVAYPRWAEGSRQYEAAWVKNLEHALVRGHWGILEPHGSCPRADLKRIDLILVPGVGFSLNGGRLGRGKGYYDRMLAEAGGLKCGVAFDWQITEVIPMEPRDVYLDCLLTPTRWQVVSEAGANPPTG